MGGTLRFGRISLDSLDRVVSVVDLRMLGAVEAVDSAGHSLKLGGARQRQNEGNTGGADLPG